MPSLKGLAGIVNRLMVLEHPNRWFVVAVGRDR